MINSTTEILTNNGYFPAYELFGILEQDPYIVLPTYNEQHKCIELDICKKITKQEIHCDLFYVYFNGMLVDPFIASYDQRLPVSKKIQSTLPGLEDTDHYFMVETNLVNLQSTDVLYGFNDRYNIDKIVRYQLKQPSMLYTIHTEKNNNLFVTKSNLLIANEN